MPNSRSRETARAMSKRQHRAASTRQPDGLWLGVSGLMLAVATACSTPPDGPTAPSATSPVRASAGEGSREAGGCPGGLLAPADSAGLIEPAARGVVRSRYVVVDVPALRRLAEARQPIVLNLFDDTCVIGQPREVDALGADTLVWSGWASGQQETSHITVVLNGDAVEASLQLAGPEHHQITYVGQGVHAVLQVNPAGYPPD